MRALLFIFNFLHYFGGKIQSLSILDRCDFVLFPVLFLLENLLIRLKRCGPCTQTLNTVFFGVEIPRLD